MATEQGRDTRVMIKTGSAGDGSDYTPIGGETTFSYKQTSADLDFSDKDGGKGGYGQTRITFSFQGNVKLPDVGLSALEAASQANPAQIPLKIMRGDVVRYDGLVAIGNFSADFPIGVATWSCDGQNADTPTVNQLTATE